MQLDVDQIEAGSTIRKNIAIIGAGAAGITMACKLAAKGLMEIALIEGGGFAYSPKSQACYMGPTSTNAFDEKYAARYLLTSRQRYFGGSTNCWAGWCVPLDPWDFTKRPWMNHSGWPIPYSDVASYYDAAAHELEVQPFNKKGFDQWFAHFDGKLILDSDRVKTRILHRSFEIPRFNTLRRDEILSSPNIELLLNCNVLEFECNEQKTGIYRVRITTPEKKIFYVEADQFVLATGGLENPRLLLNSNSTFPAGLGNQYDQVGRYFMEHLELRYIAELFLVDPEPAFALYFRLPVEELAHIIYACFSLSEKTQAAHELYNCSFYLNYPDQTIHRPHTPFKNQLWYATSRVEHLAEPHKHPEGSSYLGSLTCRAEHAPHPDNRIVLHKTRKDPYGTPLIDLTWKARHRDYQNIYDSLQILAREFGRTGKGRLKLTINPDAPDNPCLGGPHHMGTTRMSEDPRHGVVDSNCKVHGLNNLYVAGSSVFPTGGFANPTLTLVALGLRLADHLERLT